MSWDRIIVIAGIFAILCGLVIGLFIGFMSRDLPSVDLLTQYKPAIQTEVLDVNGDAIGRYYDERRLVLTREEIPDIVIKSLIAAEDQDFYQHNGFDYPGIARALLANIKSAGIAQGASTISQQVARLVFLTLDRTFTRKIKEAILTVLIERKFSKEEILTIYLNQICFGHGAYGIEAAARTFYQKSTSELTIDEAALLMSTLKNSVVYSPIKNPENALKSRNLVLSRMLESRFISESEYNQLIQKKICLNVDEQAGFIAPYFVAEVRKRLIDNFSEDEVKSGGLIVHTTLDRQHQDAANRAISEGLRAYQRRHPDGTDIQAALIAIKPENGAITAMVGGSNFKKTKFNRAVQGKRQPGSAIKPFVYLAALEKGFSPSSPIMDEPYEYIDPQTRVSWKPQNYDKRFRGPVTLRRSLEKSLNIPTAKLIEKIGIESFLETLELSGVSSKIPPYPASSLGAGEVTLLELTNAYATIAAQGLRSEPYLISKVENSKHREIFHNQPRIKEVLPQESCFQLTCILKGAVRDGTCWRVRELKQPVAAKTGTTNNYTNAWFIGFTPEIVVGVWIGFDVNQSMGHGETGSKAAGPVFVNFMKEVLSGRQVQDFKKPSGITTKFICHESGYLADENCPNVIKEAFKEDQIPRIRCPLHSDD